MQPDWDALIDQGWIHANDAGRLIGYFTKIHDEYPTSARVKFELANALDYCGQEMQAIPLYQEAIHMGGLSSDYEAYALLQLGSSLRNVGRVPEALAILGQAQREFPHLWSVSLFQALALHSSGRDADALKTVMLATLKYGESSDLERYRRALANYIGDIE